MYHPEATLRLLRKSLDYLSERGIYYGPHGMERRILRCCAENPTCPFKDECYRLYVQFVNRTNDPKAPTAKKEKVGRSVIETYHFHGLKSLGHGTVLRC